MAHERKKNNRKRRAGSRVLGLLLLMGLFALNVLIALFSLVQKRYDLAIGVVVPETIHAPRAAEDTGATELLRQTARESVSIVFALDKSLAQSLVQQAEDGFAAIGDFRSAANTLREQTALISPDGTSMPDDRSWQVVMAQDVLLSRLSRMPVPVTDAALGYALLSVTDEELLRLQEIVLAKLSVQLPNGVAASEVETLRAGVSRELQITTLPARLKELGELFYDVCFQPTLVEDTTATTRAREEAAAAVAPVMLARGVVIAEKGERLTDGQYAMLSSLGLVRGVNENRVFVAGVIGYLFVLYVLFGAYLAAAQPELFDLTKRMLMLLLIVGITVLLEWVCFLLDPRISPAILAVLLSAVLLSRQTARAVNVLLALSFGMMAGRSGDGMFGSASFLCAAAWLLGGQAAIGIALARERRGSLIAAGAVAGGVGAVVALSGCAMLGETLQNTLALAGLTLLPPVILSVFCVGMLSVWENVFDVVTATRLHELLNGNHPLLRKMMTAAPGTFHHSTMAASLAEAAAESIGANAMLARAGAMYHDVGKLRRPSYFSENQTDGNIHDTLPPEESADVIIRHQRDAETLLTKHRIPSAVRAIASEHHGTTLVAYFYYKAKRDAGDMGVSEAAFRYPGPRPSTRESAIVMMADSCEAAVRSLGDATPEQIADMVHKVILGKLTDGQLMDCPITMQEIGRIEKSFLTTFSGILHDRVRYPGDEEDDET